MDVVIIASIRPRILELTIKSFMSKLLTSDVRFIVNVDPVGEKYSQQDVIDVIRKYSNNIVSRTPDKSSFSDAVRWCWSQVESEYFLHLEDDWCLKKNVDINSVIKILSENDVQGIRLNLSRNKKDANESGFVESDGLSLNPTIFKTSFIKTLLPIFDISKDPEKQFRVKKIANFYYYGLPGESSYVIDTGKKWRKYMGLTKWSPTETNITWKNGNKKKYYYFLKYNLFLIFWGALY